MRCLATLRERALAAPSAIVAAARRAWAALDEVAQSSAGKILAWGCWGVTGICLCGIYLLEHVI